MSYEIMGFIIFGALVTYYILENNLKNKAQLRESTISFYSDKNYTCHNLSEWDFKELISENHNYYTSKVYTAHTFDNRDCEIVNKINFDGIGNNTVVYKCCIASHQNNLYLCKKINSFDDWFFLIFHKNNPIQFIPNF